MSKIIKFLKDRAIFVVLALLVILMSVLTDRFLTVDNLFSIARQVSMLGIASIGMTFVILLGGIDLSIGSIITFANIVGAYFMVVLGMNMWITILLMLVFSTLIGLLNGFIIAEFNMPALIVTFATQIIFEGLAYMISGGMSMSGFPKAFSFIGQGYLWVIPVPVILMCICFVIGALILNRSYFGRYFYALGGNEEASLLSGISVHGIKCLVYALSGLFAGIAAVVFLSRTNSGQPNVGKGYEFNVITAVVLGGVSVNGGYGRISNVVAGVLIIGILSNGMVLLDISAYMQMVVKGIILLLAVGFDCVQKNGFGNSSIFANKKLRGT